MKKVISLVLMLTVFFTISGQEKKKRNFSDDLYMDIGQSKDSINYIQPLDGLSIDQLNQYKNRAITTRNIGISMTMIGGVTAITSYCLAVRESATQMILIFPGQTDLNRLEKYGTFFYFGSITALCGIPVWILGSSKKQNAEKAIIKLEVNSNASQGLGLRFSIRF